MPAYLCAHPHVWGAHTLGIDPEPISSARSMTWKRQFKPPFRVRHAVVVIVTSTTTIVVVSAAVLRLIDRRDFPSLGRALWWSVQTITTVGYGDVTPRTTAGWVVAGFVMLSGIALASVVTATVASAFFVSAQRRRSNDDPVVARLDELSRRLDSIERTISAGKPP
jgi:voltage-gated potassium channel